MPVGGISGAGGTGVPNIPNQPISPNPSKKSPITPDKLIQISAGHSDVTDALKTYWAAMYHAVKDAPDVTQQTKDQIKQTAQSNAPAPIIFIPDQDKDGVTRCGVQADVMNKATTVYTLAEKYIEGEQ